MKDVAARQIDWGLVAKSELIVVGALRSLALDADDPVRKATNGAYQSVELFNAVALVGQVPAGTLRVHLSSSENVLPQRKFVLFLNHVEFAAVSGFYLADSPSIALQEYSPELEGRIAEVHAENTTAMEKGLAFRPSADDPVANEVKRDLEALLNPAEQQAALRRLLDKGDKAVPYLVSQLDDWRGFIPGQITVPSNQQQGFESKQHYRPELMIDAIDIILTRITMMSFRVIGSGATTAERKAVVRAWNTYLGRRLSGL